MNNLFIKVEVLDRKLIDVFRLKEQFDSLDMVMKMNGMSKMMIKWLLQFLT